MFWAGALAEMGDRDLARGRAGAARAGAQGARPALSAPARWTARPSTASGTCSCATSATQQIPRAGRAARHQAAAAWIEAKAGERVEDLADVLAYHYEAALELSQAAGLGEQRDQLQAQAVRYLALAGERALALDVEQAERQLSRALELCAPGDGPSVRGCSSGWA